MWYMCMVNSHLVHTLAREVWAMEDMSDLTALHCFLYIHRVKILSTWLETGIVVEPHYTLTMDMKLKMCVAYSLSNTLTDCV